MIREGKIGFAEGFALLLLSNLGKLFLSLPSIAIEEGKTMAWAVVLTGTVGSLVSFWIITSLMKEHQDLTIVEASERIMGPYLGTLVNVCFFIYFVIVIAILERGYAEAFLTTALPRSPISVVLLTLKIGIFISCFYGLEAMARVARASLTYILIGMSILFVSVIPYLDWGFIYPLWSSEPLQIVEDGIMRYSLVSEGLVAAVIIHAFGGWQYFRQAGLLSLAVGGVIFMVTVLLILLTFGVQASTEHALPVYTLSRIVAFGRFFQRLESVFLLTWAMLGFVKLAITLYAANAVLARVLRLQDFRPLLGITSLLCLTLSILPPDLPTANLVEHEIIRNYGNIIVTGLPLLLLLVSKLRKVGKQQADGAETS